LIDAEGFRRFVPMGTLEHNLLGLTREELGEFAESIGESRYRGSQLFRWMYGRGERSFRAMTDLGKDFRGQLMQTATINGLTLTSMQPSAKDLTRKFLFSLPDGLKIETVLLPPAFQGERASGENGRARRTLCVSTQVGCPLRCAFCATGVMGYRRNLTAGEIVDQFLQVKRTTREKITNIVFMGMGEPLMNYENVMKAVDILSTGAGVTARRITISTAGVTDGIRRMGDERRRPKLALSLHSALDETRASLMPIAARHPLADVRGALEHYVRRTKQRITYEQIFFDGVNDSEDEVRALIKWARHLPCKINVIPFHSIAFTGARGLGESLRPSPKMKMIVEQLRASDLTVFIRSSAGEDIEGACGQLAVLEERRSVLAEETRIP
jgi:23S rRNA (adenine2503-C2)-methyltransferase